MLDGDEEKTHSKEERRERDVGGRGKRKKEKGSDEITKMPLVPFSFLFFSISSC